MMLERRQRPLWPWRGPVLRPLLWPWVLPSLRLSAGPRSVQTHVRVTAGALALLGLRRPLLLAARARLRLGLWIRRVLLSNFQALAAIWVASGRRSWQNFWENSATLLMGVDYAPPGSGRPVAEKRSRLLPRIVSLLCTTFCMCIWSRESCFLSWRAGSTKPILFRKQCCQKRGSPCAMPLQSTGLARI